MLDHLFYYYPRGEHWSKTARHTVFRFQQNPNLYKSYTELYNMRRQSSHLRNNLHNVCKAMHRERGIDREWMEQRKMSVQKTESKQSTTCSRLGSIPTKGVLADASPRTKTSKEWEELLRNTAEQEMKTELGRGKIPRKQAQYSFERHVQVYAEEDEVVSDPYCSATSSSSSDSDASLSCTPPSIRCCCSPKKLARRCQPQRKEA
jgi:hypothetical protein